MSDARRVALRGGIVFAVAWPLLELCNRAAMFPGGLYQLWIAPTLALAAAASCACGAVLERRRQSVALVGGIVATLVCSTIVWLQAGYTRDLVGSGSLSQTLAALRTTLEEILTRPFDIALDATRGGLGVAWVTFGRARWPHDRSKVFLLSIVAATILTASLHPIAMAHGYYMPDGESLRFDVGAALIVVATAVLAPAWAEKLERRLAARAEA